MIFHPKHVLSSLKNEVKRIVSFIKVVSYFMLLRSLIIIITIMADSILAIKSMLANYINLHPFFCLNKFAELLYNIYILAQNPFLAVFNEVR